MRHHKNKYVCRLTLLYFLKKKLFFKKKTRIARRSTIVSRAVDYSISISNGQIFKKLLVMGLNINKKAGEFSFTKKPYFFPLRKKKQ